MAKKTDFNWKCPHCGKRNLSRYDFQFQIPQTYKVNCQCSKCGKTSVMRFELRINKPTGPGSQDWR